MYLSILTFNLITISKFLIILLNIVESLCVLDLIEAIIFFRDPLDKHPHDVDISMLMRLCDVHNVPLATNYKAADILVTYYTKL